MPDIRIRQARPEELDDIGRQTLEAYAQYEPSFPEAFWKDYAAELSDAVARAKKGTVFAVELDGKLVGSATVGWDAVEEETAHLWMLAVIPDARAAGLGPATMEAVFDHARGMGARVLKWNTLSMMEPAIRLYQRLGYEPEQGDDLGEGITLFTYRVRL